MLCYRPVLPAGHDVVNLMTIVSEADFVQSTKNLVSEIFRAIEAAASITPAAAPLMITTAESCTGGMISAAITGIAGSSAYFDRGFITYSNDAKIDMLGVEQDILKQFGAVSAECAAQMAEGALRRSRASIALSVTGIAGPTGGSAQKPVGLVYFGISLNQASTIAAVPLTVTHQCVFSGTRETIRQQACLKGLEIILDASRRI